jgi:hypothetical protein
MQIKLDTNFPAVAEAMRKAASQVPFAASVALNATAKFGRDDVVANMRRAFDRPTPWVLNSLRIKYAKKSALFAEVAFKDKNSVESSRSMIEPHVFAGKRRFKSMEARLYRAGLLPAGWNAVPGAAAKLDAYGNMSRGQITQMLNVLGTYTEAGYNKADARTRDRLAKGNVKKNVYGFAYFVSPVGARQRKHLQPGVYQRITTAFGSSLKPILIFVKRANYRARLPFYKLVEAAAAKHFAPEFDKAFEAAMKTAILKTQAPLL